MSLRTLKFKPKLLLNSASKNKSSENNSSISKDVSQKPIDNVSNPSSKNTDEGLTKHPPIEKFTSVETNVSKDVGLTPTNNTSLQNSEGTVASKNEPSSSSTQNSEGTVASKDVSSGLSTRDPEFIHGVGAHGSSCSSPVHNTSNSSVNVVEKNINIPFKDSDIPSKSNIGKENHDHIQESVKSLSKSLQSKPVEGLDLPLSCSDSEDEHNTDDDHQEPLKKSKTQLIDYDALKKISQQPTGPKIGLIVNALSKNVNEDSISNTCNRNNKTKTALKEVKENVKKVSEKKSVRFKDNLSSKTSIHHNKSSSGKISPDGVSDQKVIRKKRGDGKSANIGLKKLASHPKSNFKPNLAALGKLRRPDKFSSFSYSQMEFLAMEQFYEKFGNTKEPDSSKLTMKDLIFYNPSSNPMSQSSDKKLLTSLNNSAKKEKVEEDLTAGSEKTDESKNDEQPEDDILPVPQLKISADGKVIVAQESLVVKPSQNSENVIMETVIDEECRIRRAVKNPNRCGWSHEDTIKFYKALNSLGCDFETMMTIFPDRSRKNLKSKFKREEKLHGSLINKVLSRHSEFDVASVVEELEIDSVYQSTIKNYGRDLEEKKKRSRGRKKPFSSVVAGSSPSKEDEESDDDPESFTKKKQKLDPNLMLKITNVLNLSEKNSLNHSENNSKLTEPLDNQVEDLKEVELPKRKRKKIIENLESDDCFIEDEIEDIIDEKNKADHIHKNSKFNKRKQKIPMKKNMPTKNIVIRLEDLIDFNEGMEKEESQNNKEDVQENHIIINTNIEFENVKYTRYISYNSNNLENPIEINETVAHVD